MRLLSIVLFLCAPLCAQETLRVLTYNMQGMRPGSNWQVRLVFMIQSMEELDPDIILLQEINETMAGENNMAETVAEELGEHFGVDYHYSFAQTHIAWDEFREGVGIVSKHPVIEEGSRVLPRGTFLRKAAWNRIDSPIGMVNVFSTHLSFGSQNAAVRLQQATEIRNYVAEIEAAYPSVAAIVGGDFNTSPDTPPITFLTNAVTDTFYYDTWAELRPEEPGHTVPAESPSDRIDYIFYRNTGDAAMDTCTIEMNQTYDGTHYTSDHLGVMTVFRHTPSETGPGNPAVPKRFGLLPNYPNPFNSNTTISYSLAKGSDVRIDVWNLLGQPVVTLVNERRPGGEHHVSWSPDELSSGMYLVRLSAESRTSARSAIYCK